MRLGIKLSFSFTFLLCACGAIESAQDTTWPETVEAQVGQTYEILWTQSTETAGDTGSSGSSSTRMGYIETVLEAGAEALVLEYDLPLSTSDIDRRRSWQFPARVRKTPDNELILLNADELKVRNDDWLAWGNYTQADCGQWFFTWVAQKIECDPNSAIGALQRIDIRLADLTVGATYSSPAALAPVTLRQAASDDHEVMLSATLALDPEKIQAQRAESDLILAEIMGKTIPSYDEALRVRQTENVSGTIDVTFTLNAVGEPVRRVQTTHITIINQDGQTETSKTIETVERTEMDRPDN